MQDQELSSTNEQLQACQGLLQEWQDKYMRVNADLENFRRRVTKDQAQWRQSAKAELLGPLLSIVDDFDRALELNSKNSTTLEQTKAWFDGIMMIRASLGKYLETADVKEMVDNTHFDPEYHEALMQVESAAHSSGAIVEVLQKGYLFKGEVLRHAKVSVAK